jgi:hypothetical protein
MNLFNRFNKGFPFWENHELSERSFNEKRRAGRKSEAWCE